MAHPGVFRRRNVIDCGNLPLREGRVGAKRTSDYRGRKEEKLMQQSQGNQEVRPPVPPFDEETARQKVKAAQDAWNTRDPERVALAYTEDSKWRNRDEFFEGRELDYRLEKNLWCFTGNRIAVRFEYESHDAEGQWWRSHGNELWEFDENGLMQRRDASINDYKIDESERKFRWTR
jgi:nuclear transport factor 2 (NTF2) superfamily protein